MADAETTDSGGAESLRTPIVAVLGHVDHGKTSLLDKIRGSAVTAGEAGAITQHIGATAVPLETISDIAGELVDPTDFSLPGLLFIDTPGHHSFSTLRARGGALADIAILVVDVNDGFQPQTKEAVDILKRTKTPFIVAANKIDTTPGWNPNQSQPIQKTLAQQSDRAESRLNEQLYELIGELSGEDFSADMYWRVTDFQANIGVVPVSAETGEGVPDLLTVLMGLSQRYLKSEMAIDVTGPGVGTVLEVKDERGFGTTIDVVLYDGTLRSNDKIVVGGVVEPIVTEVRALLRPRPLEEIRIEREFEQVHEVKAAAGIKIAAPDLDSAMAGAPVRVVRDARVDSVIEQVQSELEELEVPTEDQGVVVKADTLGSLEALSDALTEADIQIVRAEVGDVARRDVAIASTAEDMKQKVILAFNINILDDAEDAAEESDVRIFSNQVIYQLIEEYEEFIEQIERSQRDQVLENIHRPCRFRILEDHVFRQSNPAVVGIEVLNGLLKRNTRIEKWENSEPTRIGELKSIQDAGEDIETAQTGDQVAASIEGPTVGRQINEGDELWVELPEKHAKILEQELSEEITGNERDALRMYLEKHRRRDPFWGK